MNEHEVALQAVKETEKLQNARRDFETLKRDEDKYLADRESKAQARIETILKRTDDAVKLLAEVGDKIGRRVKDHSKRFRDFVSGLYSLLDRTEEILKKAAHIEEQADKTLEIYQSLTEDLREKTAELSTFEKSLKERERKAESREKRADEKYTQAKRLALWHKSGTRYNEKDV